VAEFPEWSAAQKAKLRQQAEMFFDPAIFRDVNEVYEWLKEGTEQNWLAFSPEVRRELAAEHPDGIFAEWLTSAR
jgi:hypothetical protein